MGEPIAYWTIILFLYQMTLLRWLTFLLESLTVTLWNSIVKFWSCCCLSFHWLSNKLKMEGNVPQHGSWLFLCWITSQSSSLPRNLVVRTFGELLIVFSTNVNLLYLLSSTTPSCYLLHLIKRNCLLKTFLRTLILKNLISLYLFSFLELIWNYIIFQ